MRQIAVLCFSLMVWATSAAGPAAAPVRTEIESLLAKLQSSGCEFNRNGSWYSGTEAKAHLLRKLEYLEGKDLVSSTEKFIELGASTSSSSGKPYLVRCGTIAPQESGKWLTQELKAIRAARIVPASSPR